MTVTATEAGPGPSAGGAAPALEVDEVSVRFGVVAALDGVSFDVAAGELFAVIGPNGAGKTSLFNVLSRIYDPTRGRLRYFGSDLIALRPHQLAGAGVARTFQNLGLFPMSSVLDNVLVGRSHLMTAGTVRAGLALPSVRREERAHREAAMEALRFTGIEAMAAHPVGMLPYGMQKRVEIARALAMEPRLLLLDEPVAGMSRDERGQITELVRTIHAERGVTIVIVEHDMGVVMSLADRVLVLDFGRPVALGTPAEVQANPEVIRAYLGEPLEADGTADVRGAG
ncbi:MAG TPA: ABC transporter ATP-binding protein [Acidimicrobiales bacterium]|nr:ABC transporter ATP-binding protein [Acidimicrobiales bacterium]